MEQEMFFVQNQSSEDVTHCISSLYVENNCCLKNWEARVKTNDWHVKYVHNLQLMS